MTGHAHLLGASGDGVELISLTGIEAFGYHGVYDHERRDGQRFVLDVTLQLRRGSRDDDLAGTVDYGTLTTRMVEAVEGEPVDLIETLAGRLAEICLTSPVVRGVVVTVHKPQAPMPVPVADTAVTLVRVRP